MRSVCPKHLQKLPKLLKERWCLFNRNMTMGLAHQHSGCWSFYSAVVNYSQLAWLPRQVLFCFCFCWFFLRNYHLIGFILIEQKYITKASCILLGYILYTIFNLNFEVVMWLWLEKSRNKVLKQPHHTVCSIINQVVTLREMKPQEKEISYNEHFTKHQIFPKCVSPSLDRKLRETKFNKDQ